MNDDDFAELFKQLSSGQSTGSSWQDVRVEFENLARTFSDMFRATWQTQQTDPAMGQVRDMLSDATKQLNDAVDGSPEAQQARDQLLRLSEALTSAVERAGEEIRPELVKLLRQTNAELRRRSGLDQTPPN
jgi:ABC-type transporter Mla subunit MlaD